MDGEDLYELKATKFFLGSYTSAVETKDNSQQVYNALDKEEIKDLITR